MTRETWKGKGGTSIRQHPRSEAGAIAGGAHPGIPQHWDTKEGSANLLGATWVAEEHAYNFAIYSKYASSVTLLPFGPENFVTPVLKYRFDSFKNKTGRVWHARIRKREMGDARYYSYSIEGPPPSGDRFERHAFDPQKMLLDPYAKFVFFPPAFDRMAAVGPGDNAGKAPLGVLCEEDSDFDWGDDPRPRHDHDLIIYEMHVRGFTMNPHSGVEDGKRGTFAGLIEKIPYLRELGVTAVELMPVFQFDATEPNYWGYMPLNFFSPHDRYAAGQCVCEQRREFREMVKALHEAGIEVILDVVYNHTGEGNEFGPVYSFKAIDNSTYYMASDDSQRPMRTSLGRGIHCTARIARCRNWWSIACNTGPAKCTWMVSGLTWPPCFRATRMVPSTWKTRLSSVTSRRTTNSRECGWLPSHGRETLRLPTTNSVFPQSLRVRPEKDAARRAGSTSANVRKSQRHFNGGSLVLAGVSGTTSFGQRFAIS